MPPWAHLLFLPLYAIAGVVSACLWAVVVGWTAWFVGWVLVKVIDRTRLIFRAISVGSG